MAVQAGWNALGGRCIADVLAAFFALPSPRAALSFARHSFELRWENCGLCIPAEQLPCSARVEGAELGTHRGAGDVAAANSALKLLMELSVPG